MTRILTIEDDAVTAKEIVAELTSHGLEVDWADNGREGLAKAIAGGYDLITLDRMLPEVDGRIFLGVISFKAPQMRDEALQLLAVHARVAAEAFQVQVFFQQVIEVTGRVDLDLVLQRRRCRTRRGRGRRVCMRAAATLRLS